MKTKSLTSSLLIFSIWCSLFAPFVKAQQPNPTPTPEPKGLQFRISEGSKTPEKRIEIKPTNAENLDESSTNDIFRRLPEMPAESVEKASFNIRPDSPKPPKTGNVIEQEFPADEKLPAPNVSNSVPQSLEIERFSPSGNVPVVTDFSVTFSQPMIAVSTQESASQTVPVTLSPAVKGKWRWLGTTTLIFDAETRFPMATVFTATIPKGTKSAAGGILEKDVSWTFTTPPPKVESLVSRNQPAKRDQVLVGFFNQRIDPDAVLPKVSVAPAAANGRKIPLRLATTEEIEMNPDLAKNLKSRPEGSWIAFRAQELFPIDSKLKITFNAGIPSAEGKLTSKVAESFPLQTIGDMKVKEASCDYGNKPRVCEPDSGWQITFSNPIDEKSFDKSKIKIDPEIKDFRFIINARSLFLNVNTEAQKSYKITIPAGITDIYGQSVKEDFSTTFFVERKKPSLYNPIDEFLTILPSEKPVYSVNSTSYSNLKVRIYQVNPEDYHAFLAFNQKENQRFPHFGKLVANRIVKVKPNPKDSVSTDIDLSPAFKNKLGHAVLIVDTPTPDKEKTRILKWIQSTNIGLDAFDDSEQISVYASNLRDGKPLNGVELSLTNGAKGTTAANGIANFELLPRKDKKRILLFARQNDDSAIFWQNDGSYDEDYSDDDEDQEGKWSRVFNGERLRWFVFDDRKMYRPGDTVSVKGYVRKVTGGKISDISELADSVKEITFLQKDSRNVEISKGSVKINAFGAFDLQLKLPENINLGYQSLILNAATKLDSAEFTHNFQIQEFRRPEFEVSTKVESAAPFYIGDSATLLTEGKYFSGGGLATADVDWSVSSNPTNYTPPNREDFTFGKFTPWWKYSGSDWELKTTANFEGKTDAEGNHRVKLDFIRANPSRPYTLDARASIQDVNRQTFSDSTTLLVHPSKLYVGLRSPKTFVQSGEQIRIETLTTDIDGKVSPNAPVKLVAELSDMQQVKGEWKEVVVDSQTCERKSGNEIVTCDFKAKQGGTYTITASVLDNENRRNESEITVWVAGGTRKPIRNIEEQEIDLIPGKEKYSPGENAELLLNAPFYPADGILTVSQKGIVKTECFTIESPSKVLQIPIEDRYLPNINVRVTLVGESHLGGFGDERDAKLPKVPAYASGDIDLNISTDSRKLNVTAEPISKTLPPGGETKINVAVKDNNGNSVANSEVAIVAVDESVLALTSYQIENPLDVFYEKAESEINDSHSRASILLDDYSIAGGIGFGNGTGGGAGNAYLANSSSYFDPNTTGPKDPFAKRYVANSNAAVAANAAPANTAANSAATLEKELIRIAKPNTPNGGQFFIDGFAGDSIPSGKPNEQSSVDMMKLRQNFAELAIFAPSVKTDANGKATVNIKLPDNLTRYRITAVAVTKSKQFGLGESNITAKQALQVRSSPPRFMNFGDRVELPVVLQNQTDSPLSVNVAVRASNAILTNGNGKKVTVAANDRVEIRFPVSTISAGTARFQIGAVSGKLADATEFEFPVYTPATTEAFATYGTTEANGAIVQTIFAPKDVYSEFGGLEVSTSSTQLQELTDAFIYLQNYPFECSEQISSRVLSVAALRDILTAFEAKDMPSKEEIEAKMIADLERLQKLQHKDGGFSFWRSDDESVPYLSVHVAHAIARAKAKDFSVSDEMVNKSKEYLKNIESKYPKTYSEESRWAISSYALYVRKLFGQNDTLKAKTLIRTATLEKLSPESIGWLLSVLAGDKTSVSEVEAIKLNLMNRITETASAAHFVSNYKDGEYVLLSSDRRADGVILEALLELEGRTATSSDSQASIGSKETLTSVRGSADVGGTATAKERSSDSQASIGSKETLTSVRGSASLIPKLVRGLLANRVKGRWRSTQENAFVLLALDKYFHVYEKTKPNFVAKMWLGDAFAGEQNFTGRTTDSNLVNIPMSYLQSQNPHQNLILDKQGAGRLYYRIGMKYASKNLKSVAADYGFAVSRTYEAIDDPSDVKQNSDGSWTIRSGSRVRVRLQMIAPTRRYHVALVDNLPSGLEIINPDLAVTRMNAIKDPKELQRNSRWFDHQNLRDDRTEAFTSLLWEGKWSYSYIARATTPGIFNVPPAKAEEMYSPEIFGRSKSDSVTIE